MAVIWETYISGNVVDIVIWLLALFMAVRYGVYYWRDRVRATLGLFVLLLCFYGFWLIVRLGRMQWTIGELIRRCNEAGVSLEGIIPE